MTERIKCAFLFWIFCHAISFYFLYVLRIDYRCFNNVWDNVSRRNVGAGEGGSQAFLFHADDTIHCHCVLRWRCGNGTKQLLIDDQVLNIESPKKWADEGNTAQQWICSLSVCDPVMCRSSKTHKKRISALFHALALLPSVFALRASRAAFQTLQWSHFFSYLFRSTQLEVSTTDFAGNLVEGPAILVITVIDQNDNRPIFKETHYTGEVLEGSPTGRWHWCIEGLPGWKELLLDFARQQYHARCRCPADSSARQGVCISSVFFLLSILSGNFCECVRTCGLFTVVSAQLSSLCDLFSQKRWWRGGSLALNPWCEAKCRQGWTNEQHMWWTPSADVGVKLDIITTTLVTTSF